MTDQIYIGDLVSELRLFLGVRWKHRGRDEEGVDCIGLIWTALLRAGWKPRHPDAVPARYSREALGDTLVSLLRGEARRIGRAETDWADIENQLLLRPGDVLAFHFPGDPHPQHVGALTVAADLNQGPLLVATPPYFIHSDAREGRVVEHALSGDWPSHVCGAFRPYGLTSRRPQPNNPNS